MRKLSAALVAVSLLAGCTTLDGRLSKPPLETYTSAKTPREIVDCAVVRVRALDVRLNPGGFVVESNGGTKNSVVDVVTVTERDGGSAIAVYGRPNAYAGKTVRACS
jgi:hypothetical protein